jgi:hypothetical protein
MRNQVSNKVINKQAAMPTLPSAIEVPGLLRHESWVAESP